MTRRKLTAEERNERRDRERLCSKQRRHNLRQQQAVAIEEEVRQASMIRIVQYPRTESPRALQLQPVFAATSVEASPDYIQNASGNHTESITQYVCDDEVAGHILAHENGAGLTQLPPSGPFPGRIANSRQAIDERKHQVRPISAMICRPALEVQHSPGRRYIEPSTEAMNIPLRQASHGDERDKLCNSDELPEIEANDPRHEPMDTGSFHGTIRDETSHELMTMDTCNSPYDEQSDGELSDLFISPNCEVEDLGSDCSMNSSRVADETLYRSVESQMLWFRRKRDHGVLLLVHAQRVLQWQTRAMVQTA